jgi:hypothetical protein
MKRNELIESLNVDSSLADDNPKIIFSDGVKTYEVLSVYQNKKRNKIYIDIQVKE